MDNITLMCHFCKSVISGNNKYGFVMNNRQHIITKRCNCIYCVEGMRKNWNCINCMGNEHEYCINNPEWIIIEQRSFDYITDNKVNKEIEQELDGLSNNSRSTSNNPSPASSDIIDYQENDDAILDDFIDCGN